MNDLAGWRYQIDLQIHDWQDGTVTSESMGCDRLSELHDFVESIINYLENRDED
jgi:hypothetical protein